MCPQFTVLLARTLPEWYGEHSLNRFSVPMLPNTQALARCEVPSEVKPTYTADWHKDPDLMAFLKGL